MATMEKMTGETRVRVFNRAKYDIGVVLVNGVSFNIKSGSFQIMTINDVVYIESAFQNSKFFTRKLLVAVDEEGNDIDVTNLGFLYAEDAHLSDIEISEMLKQSAKKIEAWLDTITDDAELHAIYTVAKDMDLPSSKLKILSSKIKNKDWLGEIYGEEEK